MSQSESDHAVPVKETDVLNEELEHIGVSRREKLVGLAISGGGIRSASFGMGVMQSLAKHKQAGDIDYLSTVSGGGYIGSSLTWFLHKGLPNESTPQSIAEGGFPFGRHGHPGARAGKKSNGADAVLNYIRQHGNYLTPGHGLTTWTLIGAALRTMIITLLFYFSLLTIVVGAVYAGVTNWVPGDPLSNASPWLFAPAAVAAVAFLVIAAIYAIVTGHPPKSSSSSYSIRTLGQKWMGRVAEWTVALLVIASVPFVYDWVKAWIGTVTSSGLTLGGALGMWHHVSSLRGGGDVEKGKKAPILSPAIACMLVIYALMLGAFALATLFFPWDNSLAEYVWGVVIVVAVIAGVRQNCNHFGLHRMYRDRLMETFLPDKESVASNQWDTAKAADRARLAEMCSGPENERPYHLINANLVIPGSKIAKFRGRGGDSFLFSPLYCGSDATDWRPSGDYMGAATRGKGMTLATAMAISGAAMNPNAGVSGRGATTSRTVSTLMSLLGLRLGYWAPNPAKAGWDKSPRPNLWTPCLLSGVLQGVLPDRLSETGNWLEFSDGGHFENLGIYELIRRRCRVIVSSDAGADPNFDFADLANALERCRVDFGVNIDFSNEYSIEDLIPRASEVKGTGAKFDCAKRGYAVAKIRYPANAEKNRKEAEGTLILVKTTMIHGLPADVIGYKAANDEFPDQPTSDQFFGETQLEAYRELGYRIGKSAAAEIQRALDNLLRPPPPPKPAVKKKSAEKDATKAKPGKPTILAQPDTSPTKKAKKDKKTAKKRKKKDKPS